MFDAATFVLLTIALVPARWFQPALAAALRHRHAFAVAGLAVCLGGLALASRVVLVLGALPLAIWVHLLFLHLWMRGPSRRGEIALCGLALLWTLPVPAILSAPLLEPPGTARFWVVDAFTKFLLAVAAPLLAALGLPEATQVVLGYFTVVVLFVSEYLFAIVLAANIALVALAYELMRGKDPALPARIPSLSARLPRLFSLLVIAMWIAARRFPEQVGVVLAWQGCAVVAVLSGTWTLHLLTAHSSILRSSFWASLLVAFLHPVLFGALIALAIVSSFVDLPGFASRFTPSGVARESRVERVLTGLRRRLRAATLLAIVAFVSAPALVFFRASTPVVGPPREPAGAPRTPRDDGRGDRVAIATANGRVLIDRFEARDPGTGLPRTGVTADEADRLCHERGARLCTRDEWAWACSGGEGRRFPHAEASRLDRVAPLIADCNVGWGEGLRPVGSLEGCRTPEGVRDLAGNAFEWVRIDAPVPGLNGLVGGYHAYDDDQTPSCAWVVLVPDAYLPILDRSDMGFRCCGSEATGPAPGAAAPPAP